MAGSGESTFAVNKKARHDYEVLSTLEVGVSLLGSEVKSIRAGNANLKEGYIKIQNAELFLLGCHIAPYSFSRNTEYDPTRQRKLLAHRNEIIKLQSQVQQKGLTLVPLKLYLKGGRIKLELAVARGKKLFDKRESLKREEGRREVARALRAKY